MGCILPAPVADATHYRLLECSKLPPLFDAILKENHTLYELERDAALAQQRQELLAQQLDAVSAFDSHWKPWEVVITVSAFAVGSLLIGMGIGYVYAN